jgi:uncharacterized repeat protein (TIGR03803 family)
MPIPKLMSSFWDLLSAESRYRPRRISAWIKVCVLALVCGAVAFGSSGQAFRLLATFDGAGNGANPVYASLVQGLDGNFYGITKYGGTNDAGTIFKVTSGGTLTTIYSFCPQNDCTDGLWPLEGLVLGIDGNFYGTAEEGGTSTVCPQLGCGTVFKVTPQGEVTLLHSFDSYDGRYPFSQLIQGRDGSFYGTTSAGGSATGSGSGTIFKITPDGILTTLYAFEGYDDAGPSGGLVQGTDGNFYGTTVTGGANKIGGTVYRITPAGTLTTLYNFCSQHDNGVCTDGANPYAGVIQGADVNFYGTTEQGGLSVNCETGCGTIFKVTPQGMLTVLHSFDEADGANIEEPLIQATDGSLYGTASSGGNSIAKVCDMGLYPGCGTIFRITPSGAFSTLHNFTPTEGANPFSGLVQGTNGNFYGTTDDGGQSQGYGDGTVYTLGAGLSPFVKLLPSFGKAGANIRILGNNLTAATSVTFNGTPATFTVGSGTQIVASVPAGATTGNIQVTTSNGTLTSNITFTVQP